MKRATRCTHVSLSVEVAASDAVRQTACGCSNASTHAPALTAARTPASQVAPPDAPLIVQVRRSAHARGRGAQR
jgi:hypothetical protein